MAYPEKLLPILISLYFHFRRNTQKLKPCKKRALQLHNEYICRISHGIVAVPFAIFIFTLALFVCKIYHISLYVYPEYLSDLFLVVIYQNR